MVKLKGVLPKEEAANGLDGRVNERVIGEHQQTHWIVAAVSLSHVTERYAKQGDNEGSWIKEATLAIEGIEMLDGAEARAAAKLFEERSARRRNQPAPGPVTRIDSRTGEVLGED